MTIDEIDFGAWLNGVLTRANKNAQDLTSATGKHYAYYNRLVKSGEKGHPIRPEQEVVREIGEGLVKMGLLQDAGEAEIAALYIPLEGYSVAPKTDCEPPENFDDWPVELQQALAYTKELPSETQQFIYKLWREQASAHANIEYRRQEAERKLDEREQRLRELSK